MLELVGLEGLGDRMVGQISGGQKQRVSLARTLITQPKVCLLDEPLGALDANLRERMTLELRKIREALGVTFFHVTGNESEALAMGDRMIVLDSGRALQIDPPEVVYDAPATVRVARFLNAYNVFSGVTEAGVFTSEDLRVSVPQGAQPQSAAVQFDKPAILVGDVQPEDGASLKASFVASEFMGSKVVYFFRRPGGGIVEVERHLSSSNPESFEVNQPVALAWGTSDTLFFDKGGDLIPPVKVRGAA
jgi:ABC-type Fe3+/spermidine/putrescine transport system ATPase subunit